MLTEDEYKLPADMAEIAARQGRGYMHEVKVVQDPEDIARLKEICPDSDPDVILANANTKIFLPEPHGKL